MKKRISFIVLVLSLLLTMILVGCSSSDSDANYGYDRNPENKGDIENVSESGETSPDRKIIYTASVSITSSDVTVTEKAIRDSLNSDEWVEQSSKYDGSLTVTVRIKTERLDSFINSLDGLGTIRSKEINSKDVSIDYYDNVTRKTTLETEQARLLVLLDKAESISDILQINKRLSEIESELKKIDGTIKNYDSLVEYSQVTVTVRTPYEEQKETFGSKLSRGFETGLKVAENLFIFVLVIIPFVIVIGGIVVLIIFLVKRKKKIKSGEIQSDKKEKKDDKIVTLSSETKDDKNENDEPSV